MKVLMEDLFPHVGFKSIHKFRNKAYYLGHIVNKLILVNEGVLKETDRDSFIYKRVDLSGFLLANLFRDVFKQFRRNCKLEIDKEYRYKEEQYKDNISGIVNNENINNIFKSSIIEQYFLKSFKLGNILGKKGASLI